MKVPFFSIITPCYNAAPYIEDTILSVMNQKNDSQHIIIDGGSKDDTIRIITTYQNKLSYWVSEPDQGQSHAINKGLNYADGKVINWLNGDDKYREGALNQIKALFNKPNVTAVCGTSRLFGENGTIKYSNGSDIFPNNLAKTIGWARIDQPETFFTKTAWEIVGPLNENLHYCMDREWWMRYLYKFGLSGIVESKECWVDFRIHDKSKTSTAESAFTSEHHSIFYKLGKKISDSTACDTMAEIFELDKDLNTQISDWENLPLCSDIFNYYLLKTTDQLYAQGLHEEARSYLKLVGMKGLESEDRKLYSRLKYRLKLPKSVIQYFRNIG
ncbi:MAG: glycosyltransferase [Cyclobacteriaceae bacterium]